MSIALVGGMDRLAKHYQGEAKKHGIKLSIFSQSHSSMQSKIKNCDAVVVFTNKVSHSARNAAIAEARKREIPIYQFHSCGLSTLRGCFDGLKDPVIQ